MPDQAFVSRTRESLLLQVRNTLPTKPVAMPARAKSMARHMMPERIVNFMRAPALATLSIFVTVFGGSIFSVSASDRSLPGDFLYPIKIATEQTRLALTSDKAAKLKLKTEFVDRRVDEIKTLAASPVPEQPVRLKQAAEVLKRDLNTVKLQVTEVQTESTLAAAEAVKLVDKKSEQIVQDLQQVKNAAPAEVKTSLAEAEAAAVHTGVTAVEALIQASNDPDSQWVVSEADVRQSITNKVESISASLSDSADKLRSVNASGTISNQSQATGTGDNLLLGMTSTTVGQLNVASSTLQEARTLLNENKLIEVSGKLLEAAKAVAQVDVATEQLIASSTQMTASSTTPVVPSTTETSNASSTPTAPVSTSTTTSNTTSTTTPP